jgi:putative hemolysin
MNELISVDDLSKISRLKGFGGGIIIRLLMRILKVNELNSIYKEIYQQDTLKFLQSVHDRLEIKFEVDENELARIPLKEPFITVSNHPFGALEGIFLLPILLKTRPDYKVVANFLLHRLEPLKKYIIAVNPFEDLKERSSLSGIKESINHLEKGNALGVFPSGEVSTFNWSKSIITDREWQKSALKMVKNAKVPVIPIYFHGSNGLMFQLLGAIHPMLRTAQLTREFFNMKKKTIKIRIGFPISVKEQKEFSDITQYGKFLRAKTYALGTKFEVKKLFSPKRKKIISVEPEAIIPPVPVEKIESELNKIKTNYLLFESANFQVYLAPAKEIPDIITEIGRLREVTFREVGEGTNKSIDIDEYDSYYNHLFVWDTQAKAISGAYRIGKGKDILEKYGRKGFYVNTLFRLQKKFEPILREGFEMGRSFITKEYQRRPNSLFLLWKGILYTLLRNPDYRYMFGPVSISNSFSDFSKSLIVEFIIKNHYDKFLASCIKPKMPFKPVKTKKVDKDFILNSVGDDISKLDEYIKSLENGMGSPVLMKKYLKLNGKIVSFNVDPDFNNCVDGFLVTDIFDYPIDTVKAFSKEFNDNKILERFGYSE